MKRSLLCLLACSSLLLHPASALAANLYEQPPGHYGGYTSGQFATWSPDTYTVMVADDFELARAAEVTGIRWWGGYGGRHLPPESDAFVVRIFDDTPRFPGGYDTHAPGNLLRSFTVGANAMRTATGNWTLPPDYTVGFEGDPEYEYFIQLPSPFFASTGRRYWLSIVNIPSSDYWVWEASSRGPIGSVLQCWYVPVAGPWDSWRANDDNMAFQLELVLQQLAPSVQIDEIIQYFNDGVADGTIYSATSFPGRRHRLDDFLAKLERARRGIYSGKDVCKLLIDGVPPHIMAGPGVHELAAKILLLTSDLGCW